MRLGAIEGKQSQNGAIERKRLRNTVHKTHFIRDEEEVDLRTAYKTKSLLYPKSQVEKKKLLQIIIIKKSKEVRVGWKLKNHN